MLIRRLTADDADAYRQLRVDMCREHPEAFSQTPEDATSMDRKELMERVTPRDVFPQNVFMGAFDGDRLVGSVGLIREENLKEAHRGLVRSVYVAPEARGKGVSRLLMQATIDTARNWEGLEILTLTVATTQTGARTLYTSLGFITTGLILSAYKLSDGRYIDLEEMMLRL